jgi:hypothetical protein
MGISWSVSCQRGHSDLFCDPRRVYFVTRFSWLSITSSHSRGSYATLFTVTHLVIALHWLLLSLTISRPRKLEYLCHNVHQPHPIDDVFRSFYQDATKDMLQGREQETVTNTLPCISVNYGVGRGFGRLYYHTGSGRTDWYRRLAQQGLSSSKKKPLVDPPVEEQVRKRMKTGAGKRKTVGDLLGSFA